MARNWAPPRPQGSSGAPSQRAQRTSRGSQPLREDGGHCGIAGGGVEGDGREVGRSQRGCDRSPLSVIAYKASHHRGLPPDSARTPPCPRRQGQRGRNHSPGPTPPRPARQAARRFVYFIHPEARGLPALDCGLLSPTALHPRGGGFRTEAGGRPYSGLNLPFNWLYHVGGVARGYVASWRGWTTSRKR